MHDAHERLVKAVRKGDLPTMRAALDAHPELVNAAVDLDSRVRPSDTLAMRLTHLAIAEDQSGALEVLIERGADLNSRNADGRLALHDCFELGREEMARALLTAGAVPDVCAAAAYGMHELLREMLRRTPELADDLSTGLSPLGWSAYGDEPESARILIAAGATVDESPYDVEAWGPASHLANTNLARVLLEHGANPNCQDEEGDTPVHAAIKSRIVVDPTEYVELLLAHGADAAIRNKAGKTPLEEAELQAGKDAETYYPVRELGKKELAKVMAMLRGAVL
jgi:ankyrin repeat protein